MSVLVSTLQGAKLMLVTTLVTVLVRIQLLAGLLLPPSVLVDELGRKTEPRPSWPKSLAPMAQRDLSFRKNKVWEAPAETSWTPQPLPKISRGVCTLEASKTVVVCTRPA